jgi:uncharacterized membrane protein
MGLIADTVGFEYLNICVIFIAFIIRKDVVKQVVLAVGVSTTKAGNQLMEWREKVEVRLQRRAYVGLFLSMLKILQ